MILDDLKKFLRVTHDEDDDLLTALGEAAEDDMLRYLNVSELPTAPSVTLGCQMLVRAAYDTDNPDDAELWRAAGLRIAHSYREGLGA